MILGFEWQSLRLGWRGIEGTTIDAPSFAFDFQAPVTSLPIVGMTGIGKSTLLYALSGMSAPSAGCIRWRLPPRGPSADWRDITWSADRMYGATTPRPLDFGFVLQDAEMIPCFTVAENIRHALRLRGVAGNTEDHINRVRTSVELMKTESEELDTVYGRWGKVIKKGLLDKYPSQLSGGTRKRMAIAAAIAHDPAVLFADEPTSNLDRETGIKILETIHGNWLDRPGASGRTRAFIFVTHNVDILGPALGVETVLRIEASPDAQRGAAVRSVALAEVLSATTVYNTIRTSDAPVT